MMKENLIKMYEKSFRDNCNLPALTDYVTRESYTYYSFAVEIAKLHILFEKAGIKPEDKIALVGKNTPKWCIIYMATITYGATIVPILQDFTPNDIAHIVNHSESKIFFVSASHWDHLEEEDIPQVQAAISLSDFHVIFERGSGAVTEATKGMSGLFQERYPEGFTINDIKYPEIANDRIALLNYTSGTTGYSKGVMLTVNNLTANVHFGVTTNDLTTGDPYFHPGTRILSFLPLAHAYGCAFDFLSPIAAGGHITLLGKIPTPKVLIDAMKNVRPNVICSVPMVLEKVYRKQIQPMLEKGPLSIAMKVPLLNTAIYSQILNKLMTAFGGDLKMFIVGGAAMNQETESFLKKIKFPITIGYGMTECAPIICYSDWSEFKGGSCGKYLKRYLDVRIDSPDPQNIPGEILVKGECVMTGYYKNEKDTTAVLEADGTLHTGDMGTMDEDGTIYIKGRCKTMILTSTGQNIYPEQIEDKLNNLPMVLESLVLEFDGKLYGLVVPDYAEAEKNGIDEAKLKELMNENLKLLNSQVAAYERVVSLTIYPTEFEKTPKRSIKRFLYNVKKLGIETKA